MHQVAFKKGPPAGRSLLKCDLMQQKLFGPRPEEKNVQYATFFIFLLKI